MSMLVPKGRQMQDWICLFLSYGGSGCERGEGKGRREVIKKLMLMYGQWQSGQQIGLGETTVKVF